MTATAITEGFSVEETRKKFKTGEWKYFVDEYHRAFVRGYTRDEEVVHVPRLNWKLDYLSFLRYSAITFEQQGHQEIRVTTDSGKDALIETLASEFEELLCRKNWQLKSPNLCLPEKVKVISLNEKSDTLERFKEKYPGILKVAYGVTAPENSFAEVISNSCYLKLDSSLNGIIEVGSETEVNREIFDDVWMKLSDPAEFQRRKEKSKKGGILRFLFGRD